jgi:hypothetical protein
MTLIVAHLYLHANATILHLEIETETDTMIESEMLERGTGDTGVVRLEATEILEEAGEMIETEIDGAAEMREISGTQEMAKLIDGAGMIVGMRREAVGGERTEADEETEIEVSILFRRRNV